MCYNPGLLQLKMVKQKQFLQKPICIILYFTANWIPVIEKKKKKEREYLKKEILKVKYSWLARLNYKWYLDVIESKVKIFVMIKFTEIVLVNNDKYYIQMYL